VASFKQTVIGFLALLVAAMVAYLTGNVALHYLPQNWFPGSLSPTGSWGILLSVVAGFIVISLLSLIATLAKALGDIVISSLPKRSK